MRRVLTVASVARTLRMAALHTNTTMAANDASGHSGAANAAIAAHHAAPAALPVPPLSHFACWRCSGRGQRYKVRPAAAASHKRKRGNNGPPPGHAAAASAVPSASAAASVSQCSSAAAAAVSVLWEPCTACRGTGLMPRAAFHNEQGKDEDEPRTAAAAASAHSNRAADSAVAAAVPSPADSNSSVSIARRPRPPIASAQSPLIVIAGCGIGGSALALALQQRGLRVLVVERDSSCAARSQGYGLTMQQGGAALQALGVTVSGIASVQHRSFDTTGRLIGCYGRESRGESATGRNNGKHDSAPASIGNGGGRHNLHLPRQRLRTAIIEQLLPDTVRWGVSVKRFEEDRTQQSEPQSQRGVTVHLSDGSVVRCALLVGADGIRSVIRAHKFGPRAAPLQYLGLIVVLGYARTCDPSLRRRVTQTCDGCTRIYTMPFDGSHLEEGTTSAAASSSSAAAASATNDESSGPGSEPDTTMWQLSFPMDEAEALALSARGPAALKAEALRRCALWHAPIPELLESTTLDCITGYPAWDRDLPPLDLLRNGAAAAMEEDGLDSSASPTATVATTVSYPPVSPSSGPCRCSRVTMLGDAVHPMSPFKGQGANQSLLDAVALARVLANCDWTCCCDDRRAATDQPATVASASAAVAAPTSLCTALRSFESAMLARVRGKVLESRANAAFLHSPAVLHEGNCSRASVAKAAASKLAQLQGGNDGVAAAAHTDA